MCLWKKYFFVYTIYTINDESDESGWGHICLYVYFSTIQAHVDVMHTLKARTGNILF